MESPHYRIRRLHESDLNEWFRLRRLLWDETEDEDHKQEMLDIIEHPDMQMVFVAEKSSGGLAGFVEVSIRPMAEDCETENVGYLEGWFVEEGVRRNGIGTGLVGAAEQWAKDNGCEEMASDAEIGNSVSLISHVKLGYRETSRLVHLMKKL